MSMTRKEAIKVLKNGGIEVCGEADRISEFIAALDVALDALIPPTRENELEAENIELKERIVNWRNYMAPTRERVEKVWRGEWIGDNDEKVGTIDGSPMKSATCFACGNWLAGSDEYDCSGHFCPACGRAMTDEAVDIMLKRMEVLLND